MIQTILMLEKKLDVKSKIFDCFSFEKEKVTFITLPLHMDHASFIILI